MSKIHCAKLQKDLDSLPNSPYPGPTGERIQATISAEAWTLWLNEQTILINENRLNPLDKETKVFLETAMLKFLFNESK
jgi:Fe-S cluster biosynthesis and repair protein YggX